MLSGILFGYSANAEASAGVFERIAATPSWLNIPLLSFSAMSFACCKISVSINDAYYSFNYELISILDDTP